MSCVQFIKGVSYQTLCQKFSDFYGRLDILDVAILIMP